MFSYEHEYGDKIAPIIFTIFMILVAIFAAHDFYTREKEEEAARKRKEALLAASKGGV